MKRIGILALITMLLFSTGCAAVLVGGLIHKSIKTKEEKRKFMEDFRRTNLEREKAGLAPLDLCEEMYVFDPGWACDTPKCSYLCGMGD